MTETIILLRYSPALGQLVDAEGKPIGVVCVPKSSTIDMVRTALKNRAVAPEHVFTAMLAAARPDLRAATVRIPPRARTAQHDAESRTWDSGFNAALDAIK